ncbi:hypothetical protein BDF14DRAFT_526159 [Spinellus fusiger]|nr:hypothetical protein BDF14DRAFT_526159 [Spinellus fusiger]
MMDMDFLSNGKYSVELTSSSKDMYALHFASKPEDDVLARSLYLQPQGDIYHVQCVTSQGEGPAVEYEGIPTRHHEEVEVLLVYDEKTQTFRLEENPLQMILKKRKRKVGGKKPKKTTDASHTASINGAHHSTPSAHHGSGAMDDFVDDFEMNLSKDMDEILDGDDDDDEDAHPARPLHRKHEVPVLPTKRSTSSSSTTTTVAATNYTKEREETRGIPVKKPSRLPSMDTTHEERDTREEEDDEDDEDETFEIVAAVEPLSHSAKSPKPTAPVQHPMANETAKRRKYTMASAPIRHPGVRSTTTTTNSNSNSNVSNSHNSSSSSNSSNNSNNNNNNNNNNSSSSSSSNSNNPPSMITLAIPPHPHYAGKKLTPAVTASVPGLLKERPSPRKSMDTHSSSSDSSSSGSSSSDSSGSSSDSGSDSGSDNEEESGSSSDNDDDFDALAENIARSLSKEGPSEPSSPQANAYYTAAQSHAGAYQSPMNVRSNANSTSVGQPLGGKPMSLRALFKENEEEEMSSSSSENESF